jgi:hypothetical protein
VIRATIINTRFVGVTDGDRLDASAWEGGAVSVKQIAFEPTLGVAVIAHDYGQPGSSQVTMGTDGRPALVYVTRDVTRLNANYVQAGSVICLGDWDSRGGPELIYDTDYMTRLPEYFFADETSGTSGTLRILDWREIASSGP